MPPSLSSNGFWSRDPHNISHNQLHKFWVELSPLARRELLRVEKQALFEQARKNMYCSRCNGLLLEGFMQILMYGKSLHQEGFVGHIPCDRPGPRESLSEDVSSMRNGCQDETQDPSVHPWGGLITTRDGALTLLDCYIYSKSLKGLQNVFNSAHARERERELLYPDACGGGGRGWISQGMTSYSRGHGTRESCALHTARLSCDTLVDFWSALGEETRQSLLKMKEEDFIERLMYRFDSKRFCRDCRKNVIREFKELKELKRVRRETHCTSWFCATDTAFQYEVSEDMVQADWCQTFADTIGTYHHFEWAVGTAEGKSDILEFENVGMKGSAQAKGLELGDLGSCYITLKAWKLDGHSTELSVKAHALKDQQCVHGRLVVGDGIVAITRGESIRRFFEHAEEAEEDEDDDALDKDGNELDGECSRPQKHAKSPELAREFLLDAATVIFMEQVEKAFREGTARQNAHSIFVCLALKLLEERVHVACKEIIALEKQMKLLEEEEKEKVEEEERKERRRTKEREKKLRRKERLKGKGKDRENNCLGSSEDPVISDNTREELSPQISDKMISSGDSFSGTVDIMVSRPQSPVVQDDRFSNGHVDSETENSSCDNPDGESSIVKDENGLFMVEQSKFSHCRSNNRRESVLDPSLKRLDRRRFAVCSENETLVNNPQPRLHVEKLEKGLNGLVRHLRANAVECSARNAGLKFGGKFQYSNNRMSERCNLRSCSCNQHSDYRAKVEPHVPLRWENRSVSKFESVLDVSKQFYRGNKFNRSYYTRESCGRSKNKTNTLNNTSSRDSLHTKKVWEPMESKKYNPCSNSDSDIVTLRSSEFKVDGLEPIGCCAEVGRNSGEIDHEDNNLKESRILSQGLDEGPPSGFEEEVKRACYSTEVADAKFAPHPIGNSSLSVTSDRNMSSTSNSDNCSSCLSEGDSNTASSNSPNVESLSTSDSEDASQQSERRETPACIQNIGNPPTKFDHCSDTTNLDVNMGAQRQGMLPLMHNQNVQVPVYEAPSPLRGLYHQNPASWPAAPNVLMPFPHPNNYLLASPFGYGLNESSHFCMQYGALQRFPTTPLFDPSCQSPVYHPDSNADGIITKEHIKVSRPGKAQAASNGADVDKAVPKALCPTERLPNGEAEQKENSAKVHMGNNGFSLFHFGGPVAMSTGHKSDCVPSKEGGVGDFPPNVSPNHVDGDGACNKKETTIEEYDLFAASNGIRFSFF